MRKTYTRCVVLCAVTLCGPILGLAGSARAQAADRPDGMPAVVSTGRAVSADADPVLPELPEAARERLRELSEKDPAAFRDLLRRSLSARLIWAARGEKLPPDFPVEMAGGMTDDRL
jgi:hypothetical protein